MEELKARVSKLEKDVAVLQNENEHVSDALKVLGDRMTAINDKKLTPMQKQLTDIHDSLHGSRGFVAGMFMTVGMLWAVVATLGLVIWNWIKT